MPTSMRPMRSMISSRPDWPSFCSGVVALATLAAALVHGPGLAGLGLIGAYVTPAARRRARSRITGRCISISRSSPRPPMRWRACGCGAGLRSRQRLLAALDAGRHWSCRARSPAHAFHALAGFALASAFIVAGLLYGPQAERGRFDARVLRRAGGISVRRVPAGARQPARSARGRDAVRARGRDHRGGLAQRSGDAGRSPAAALLALLVVAHWATSDYFVVLHSPGGPLSGLPLVPKLEGLRLASAFGAGIAADVRRRGLSRAGPRRAIRYSSILWAATGVLTPVITLIALYYGIADFERSIPFAAIALLLAALFALRDRNARQPRHRARKRRRSRDLCLRHRRRAGAGARPSRWKRAGSRSRSL